MTSRDALHEQWEHNYLWVKMLMLIGAGSVLSYLVNRDVQNIAMASFMAFMGAGFTDTVVYRVLGDKSRFLKINGSNIMSAAVDSFLFPALAFGFPLMWGVIVGQFVAKAVGGFIWGWVLRLWK